MRKKILAVALTAAALLLSGCSSAYETPKSKTDASTSTLERESDSRFLREETVKLNDGRTVVCVTYRYYESGGLSCDWAGAE